LPAKERCAVVGVDRGQRQAPLLVEQLSAHGGQRLGVDVLDTDIAVVVL